MVVGAPSSCCEVAVIGGGPGGYLAAIRLAQRGRDVLLIDDNERLGGVCLNEGCIPSKALIHAAQLADDARGAARMGIRLGAPEIDMPQLIRWKDGIVERLTDGVRQLLRHNGAQQLRGRARFCSSRQLQVDCAEGVQRVDFEHAVIASGSRPVELPGLPVDGVRVIGSREALSLQHVPDRMVIVGAGYIGLELGVVYRHLGARVALVDVLEQLLPDLDPEVGALMSRRLRKLDIALHLGQRATGLSGDQLTLDGAGDPDALAADVVAVCGGRRPHSDDLGLDAAGVALSVSGHVTVDEQMRTSATRIFAIGDVVAGPPLAHKAYREAEVAAAAIAGEPTGFDNQVIPAVIYTDPEIAWAGLTETQARTQGIDVLTGTFPLRASGRAMTLNATDGLVKAVAEAKHQRLIGVQIVAPNASELIGEAALAIEMGAFLDDISQTIHPHPTLGEGLQEAMHLALGRGIHVHR